MPVTVDEELRMITQREFAGLAYQVMRQVFAVHRDMGRFLDEHIYRQAIADRLSFENRQQVRITIRFEQFIKSYLIDLLVCRTAVFELKAVTQITNAHRSQLLNYLLLCELPHGKLVNLHTKKVEHEFVNTSLRLRDRTEFGVVFDHWQEPHTSRYVFSQWFEAFLRDVGTCLDIGLYNDAATHCFGGEEAAVQAVKVSQYGYQKVRMSAPDWALKITTLDDKDLDDFAEHALRFLRQTELKGIQRVESGVID